MIENLLPAVTLIPFIGFLALALPTLFGIKISENFCHRLVSVVMPLHLLTLSILAWGLYNDPEQIRWARGTWFITETRPVLFELFIDRMEIALLWTSSFICGVIGHFLTRYLHRDPGFQRFFILFLLFIASVSLVETAGNFELLILGWETVGLSSVFLMGFFQFRIQPTASSFYTLVTYRICDIALLTAVVLIHFWSHEHHVSLKLADIALLNLSEAPGPELGLIGTLFLIGCLGKSAQLPFCSWLPRAMVGPTPSSAVFYGAVSAHMGAFLLLRLWPLLKVVPFIPHAIVCIGLSTAFYAVIAGRTRSDAKTQLAFAAMAQLGLIFAEIGMGWNHFALFHMIGHSFLRTLQFLTAPSLLHEFHQMGANGKRAFRNSFFGDVLLPKNLQSWFYRHALQEVHLPLLIEKVVVRPYFKAITCLDKAERKWMGMFQ